MVSCEAFVEFGPGRYRFFLPLKAQVEVERLCANKALGVMYQEFEQSMGRDTLSGDEQYLDGPARGMDAYQIIRIAAQYGGEAEIAGSVQSVSAIDATRLVDQYVDGRPYTEFIPVAWHILKATLRGITLQAPKKKAPAKSRNRSRAVKS